MAPTATIAYIGATSGTGFSIYSRLAPAVKDVEHVILLRSLDRFKKSPQYQTLSPEGLGRTVFVEGDALDPESVSRFIERCGAGLRAVITTLGTMHCLMRYNTRAENISFRSHTNPKASPRSRFWL